MELDYKAIGRRVKIARIKKGMSENKLSEITEMSNSHISNIENGHTKASLPALITVANALSVSIDDILCDNVIRSKPSFERIIADILEDCNDIETRAIAEVAQTTKIAFRRALNNKT